MHFLLSLFSLVSAQCPASLISTSSAATLIERSPGLYTPSALVPSVPSVWVALPGANWIWESASNSVGAFDFVNTFTMAEWASNSIAHLRLYIAADNAYSVVFNGEVLAGQWTGGFFTVDQYDLKPWILGSSVELGSQVNRLEMKVWNSGGPGGLLYKLVIEY